MQYDYGVLQSLMPILRNNDWNIKKTNKTVEHINKRKKNAACNRKIYAKQVFDKLIDVYQFFTFLLENVFRGTKKKEILSSSVWNEQYV